MTRHYRFVITTYMYNPTINPLTGNCGLTHIGDRHFTSAATPMLAIQVPIAYAGKPTVANQRQRVK